MIGLLASWSPSASSSCRWPPARCRRASCGSGTATGCRRSCWRPSRRPSPSPSRCCARSETGSVPDLGVTLAGAGGQHRPDPAAALLRPVRARAAARGGRGGDGPAGSGGHRGRGSDGSRAAGNSARPEVLGRTCGPRPARARSRRRHRGIVPLAADHDQVCVLRHAVGDFVTAGGVLMEVYGRRPARRCDGCAGWSRWGMSARSTRTRPSRCASSSTSRSGRCRPAVNDPDHGDPDDQPPRRAVRGHRHPRPRRPGPARRRHGQVRWSSGPAPGRSYLDSG